MHMATALLITKPTSWIFYTSFEHCFWTIEGVDMVVTNIFGEAKNFMVT